MSGILFLIFFCLNSKKTIYFGYLKHSSTSGDTQFYWYDTKAKSIKNSNDQYAWFFALPQLVPDDEITTNNWVKFIEENKDSVFKITGTRLNDDCDYYGPEHCIENIDVKTIQVVGTNKSMIF